MSASMRATPRRLRVTPSKQVEEGEMESGRAASPSNQLVCTQDAAVRSHCQRRPAHTLPQAHLRLGRGWQDSTAVLIAPTLSAEPDKGVESHRPSHCLHTLLQVHLRPGRGEAVSSRCRPCPVPFVVHYLCKLNEYIFFKSLLRVLLFHVDEKDLCCHSIITVQVTRLSYINMI